MLGDRKLVGLEGSSVQVMVFCGHDFNEILDHSRTINLAGPVRVKGVDNVGKFGAVGEAVDGMGS